MKIVYDDVVYSLQKAGGVSVMWSHITSDPQYPSFHIQYDNAGTNVFSAEIEGHQYDVRQSKGLQLKRYLNLEVPENTPFIFHSSYFRYCTNPNAINITNVYDFIYEYYHHKPKDLLHKIQKKRAVMHSDGVICISESTKRDLQKFYPDYKGEVRVVHCGYDTSTYYYEELQKEKIVVCVGGRKYHKRFDYTVEIMKHLSDCKLVLVGGGPITEEEKTLLEASIPGRYEKAGYLSNDELRNLYNKAFFLSYCSDYEGFGIPPLEAQACGCPVVCQAISSLPEVVEDSAIFFDPQDIESSIEAIKQLYEESFYQDIVKRGLENVKRFSWDKCKREVYEFYDYILAKKGLK